MRRSEEEAPQPPPHPPGAACGGPGWHGGADGRVSSDWLQMLFRGALCFFKRRMWNINLPSAFAALYHM